MFTSEAGVSQEMLPPLNTAAAQRAASRGRLVATRRPTQALLIPSESSPVTAETDGRQKGNANVARGISRRGDSVELWILRCGRFHMRRPGNGNGFRGPTRLYTLCTIGLSWPPCWPCPWYQTSVTKRISHGFDRSMFASGEGVYSVRTLVFDWLKTFPRVPQI